MSNLVPLYIDKNTGSIIGTFDPSITPSPVQARVFGFQHIQTTASDFWVITHNKSTTAFTYQIFTDDMEPVLPDDVEIMNQNQIKIKFTAPMTGTANLILFRLT